MTAQERYLVLCVDRDDDLGRKTRIATPITGRDAVLSAATSLLLADPEEADANSIFAAVKKMDELQKGGNQCGVAIVCGDQYGGFDADKKIRSEVDFLMKSSEYTGIVFVSDGGDDEQVIPVLQGMKPVVSVVRVAVKHSQTVEQTYLVLGRYLRMLIFEPRYSRWALGVPGLIFLLATILIIANQALAAVIATFLIIGGAFFIRGFNLDRWIAGVLSRGPYGYLRLFSTVTSVLVVIVGLSTGYGNMLPAKVDPLGPTLVSLVVANPVEIFSYGGILTGYFLEGALTLVWIGIAIYATGTLLARLVSGTVGAWRDAVVLVLLALLYFPIDQFAVFLVGAQRESSVLLISEVLVGLAVVFGLTSVVYPRLRTRGSVAPE